MIEQNYSVRGKNIVHLYSVRVLNRHFRLKVTLKKSVNNRRLKVNVTTTITSESKSCMMHHLSLSLKFTIGNFLQHRDSPVQIHIILYLVHHASLIHLLQQQMWVTDWVCEQLTPMCAFHLYYLQPNSSNSSFFHEIEPVLYYLWFTAIFSISQVICSCPNWHFFLFLNSKFGMHRRHSISANCDWYCPKPFDNRLLLWSKFNNVIHVWKCENQG